MAEKDKDFNPFAKYRFHAPDDNADLDQIRRECLTYEEKISKESRISNDVLNTRFTI